MAGKTVLMLSNVPDAETARKIAHSLVVSRLAACVNCLPQVTSVYRWQGAIEEASEIMLLIKTTAEKCAEAEALIKVLHPYELPEIIAFEMDRGLPAYLNWIEQEVQKDEDL